jgi:hypothetical protein
MSKLRPSRIFAACTALAAATALPAFADNGADRGHFTLFQHDTSQQFVATGDPSSGTGNLYIFGGDLFDRQGGAHVGRSAGSCAYSSASEILCSAALALDDGQIILNGLADTATFYSGQPVDFALTGGTGRYRLARGTVTVQILPAGTDANVTVDIR